MQRRGWRKRVRIDQSLRQAIMFSHKWRWQGGGLRAPHAWWGGRPKNTCTHSKPAHLIQCEFLGTPHRAGIGYIAVLLWILGLLSAQSWARKEKSAACWESMHHGDHTVLWVKQTHICIHWRLVIVLIHQQTETELQSALNLRCFDRFTCRL